MAIFRRKPTNGGVKCSGQKSRFSANIWLHRSERQVQTVQYTAAMVHGELMTLLAGKRRGLLMAGNDDEVYDKKPQRCDEDNRAAFNCTQR